MANTLALQIAQALGALSAGLSPADSNLQQLGQSVSGSAQSGIQGEAIKKQKEAEEKAKKGGLFGDIGALLGTAGGVALAPFTGGSSLLMGSLLGGAGGALGGAAGSALGGGGVDPYAALKHSLMGGISGGLSAATMPLATAPQASTGVVAGGERVAAESLGRGRPTVGGNGLLETSAAPRNPFMPSGPVPMGGKFSGQQQGFGSRLTSSLMGMLNPTGAAPYGAFRLIPDPQTPNRFTLGGGGY